MKNQIALYPGSFNPPHVGHIQVVSYLLSHGFSKVILIPSYKHPYSKDLISLPYRAFLCQIAISNFHPSLVNVSLAEQYIKGTNYTYKTIKYIYKNRSNLFGYKPQLRLVIGADLIDDFKKWKNVNIIKKLAKPFIVGRAGYPYKNIPIISPEISSTQIRKILSQNRNSIKLKELLPRGILKYIINFNLYK